MDDVVLLESPSLREKLCTEEHTSILERVGNLITLPDEGFATTEQVAEFYRVSVEVVKKIVIRHRDELDQDGYRVLSAREFGEIYPGAVKSKARFIAVFPRKAILRIGMLLAESEVAKQVRHYLLATERSCLAIANRRDLLVLAEELQLQAQRNARTAKEVERTAREASENAQQLISQANILKAVVQEVYSNRDQIKENRARIEKLELKFWEPLPTRLPEWPDTTGNISERQIEVLKGKVREKSDAPVAVWKKFNKHFDITRYKFLPAARFEEAVVWLDHYGDN